MVLPRGSKLGAAVLAVSIERNGVSKFALGYRWRLN
jgi:hypothetical protein